MKITLSRDHSPQELLSTRIILCKNQYIRGSLSARISPYVDRSPGGSLSSGITLHEDRSPGGLFTPQGLVTPRLCMRSALHGSESHRSSIPTTPAPPRLAAYSLIFTAPELYTAIAHSEAPHEVRFARFRVLQVPKFYDSQ